MPDVKRSFWQRLFGIPATQPPRNSQCWSYREGIVEIELSQALELNQPGGALRLESPAMPRRILVVKASEGYYAFENACRHGKRRLDPVPGEERLQCCSVGKVKYDFAGKPYSESVKDFLPMFPVELRDGRLFVRLT